jgi:putative salt-induced outer membrane protein
LLLPGLAGAQDRIIMINGDVITGNITLINSDDVIIEPTYADPFAVEMASVATIEVDEPFEVELTDDTRVLGQLTLDATGQQVLLTSGGNSMPITLAQVAEATEPEEYFEWSLKADMNGTYNGGNTDSENTLLFADSSVKWGDHRHRADLTFREESVNGANTQEQTLFNYGYNWIFSDPWFIGGAVNYERDPVRELDYRYTASALVGRDIFDDATKYLGIAIGPGYQQQKLGGESKGGAVAMWTLRYEHALLSWVDFFHTQNFTWQYYGNDNAIYKTNTGLNFDLISDLYFNVSLRYDYETEPAEGRSNDDSTFAFGVGYKF